MAKIPLNAGFTCPNRDGVKGRGGCSFCSSSGSGDTILGFDQDLQQQYKMNLERARKKWPQAGGMAYFQNYTNTYAPLDTLRKIYTPFFEDPSVEAICIATRADCLDTEMLAWFASWKKDVWIELGLQSIHESTTDRLNRNHTTQQVFDAVSMIRQAGLLCCIHIINGLPGEDDRMMMETARAVAVMHPDAVKIHMLHLLRNTRLEAEYRLHPFHLLSQEEYVNIVCSQLEILPEDIIIERITGDGIASELTAPLWTLRKTAVTNAIDTELYRRNSWQGKFSDEPARVSFL